MGRTSQSENPHYLTTGSIANGDDNAATGNDGSVEFYLKDSEYFSVEYKVTGTNATGIDVTLYMKTGDGTWLLAEDGATGKSALWTAATAARGWMKPSPPYSRGAFKIEVDNNNAGAVTVELWVHFSKSRIR